LYNNNIDRLSTFRPSNATQSLLLLSILTSAFHITECHDYDLKKTATGTNQKDEPRHEWRHLIFVYYEIPTTNDQCRPFWELEREPLGVMDEATGIFAKSLKSAFVQSLYNLVECLPEGCRKSEGEKMIVKKSSNYLEL
jgi:hypothetical protein